MNQSVDYAMFYDILLNLREYFHSYGRMDDSNAKLDEMVKLISVSYSMALQGKRFCLEDTRRYAETQLGDENRLAEALRVVCEREMKNPLFVNEDGTNIFGAIPSLAIQPTENDFARKLIAEIEKIDFVDLIRNRSYAEFDLVNECFGHFVRENFRNNKEDGQYMTPYEISGPILDIVFHDMEKSGFLNAERIGSFTVMDPTCGVGTLLMESSSRFTKYAERTIRDKRERERVISRFRRRGIVGQDKVDRMVRLSKVNALLLGSNASNICAGNSVAGASRLDGYAESVDLIFTNPPFGAEYERDSLRIDEFPILKEKGFAAKTFPSELLLLDRCIRLLKPEGYLAIILPDSVFASKGIYSAYRDYLICHYDILGVVGLPSVTFAQAGTRTNTCVLILRKRPPDSVRRTFMADCKDIGYVVRERVGVPVKMRRGINEVAETAACVVSSRAAGKILSEKPSVTMIEASDYIGNVLKPSFYAASRFRVISGLRSSADGGFTLKRLGDIVEFASLGRKSYAVSDTVRHISVLHINANCTIDFAEAERFTPVSKGRECLPGELIFSKINPRIPRMAVVPERKTKLVCSNEFEIMKTKGVIGTHALCFILKTKSVTDQIENLTAGTSSSHSRIKREQLAEILIPVPVSEEAKARIAAIDAALEKATAAIYAAENDIAKRYDFLNNL